MTSVSSPPYTSRHHAKPSPRQEVSQLVESILGFQKFAAITLSPDYKFVPLNEHLLGHWVKEFLQKKSSLESQGKPSLVEIGYHYTKYENMKSIQLVGLKCHKGRRRFFGKGLYVANNPIAFRGYGDAGLVVLVMKGVQRWCLNSDATDGSFGEADVDTFSGNKVFDKMAKNGRFNRSSYFDETVLRSDEQLLPLFWYDRDMVNNSELTWQFHCALQAWVDSVFRPGLPRTMVKRPIPCVEDLIMEHKLSVSIATPSNGSPIIPAPFHTRKTTTQYKFVTAPLVRYPKLSPVPEQQRVQLVIEVCVPHALKAEKKDNFLPCVPLPKQECSICFEKLKSDTVRLSNCTHIFHKQCARQALQHKAQCPVCRNVVDEPFGCCPPATMTVNLRCDKHCGGFPSIPTYEIVYNVPAGRQTAEHENPGVKFRGTVRLAYVPATVHGRNLVLRLCYAFRRGMTFRVGTSLTSGLSNSVVWASIHHKTVLAGGSFGWPDPNYFDNVNDELDHLKVPKAQDLPASW
ncbi:unnamed protein product [Cylindrotheca closterium]|uniref:RING-type E3 ubiquitin transferase n=1 Tax=Cylindrotheca closterium TaxID=2856 RepID=A0AAD2PWD5_9STRA|nr:unnamed protein product [Cylindrotheca closterium]